jgi:hypothetical protein
VRVMVVSRRNTTRPVREKAHHGAEKSCLTRRRKRGLRTSRDRGNADPTVRQPLAKVQSSRKVNHMGRKFIWAEKAANSLRVDMERYNKFPRGPLDERSTVRAARLVCKKHCEAKWQRLHSRALLCGFPPLKSLIFHDSFRDHLLFGSSRRSAIGDWEDILSGLPRRVEPVPLLIIGPLDRCGGINRHTIAQDQFVPRRRVCRTCGYLGPGQHAWNSCRTGDKPKANGGRRQSGVAMMRRCGCLRGQKCPH